METLAEQVRNIASGENISDRYKAEKLLLELTSGEKFNALYKFVMKEIIDSANMGSFNKKFYNSSIEGFVYNLINYDQFVLLCENDYIVIMDAIKSALEKDGFNVESGACSGNDWSFDVSW